jgi:hypothetical protein
MVARADALRFDSHCPWPRNQIYGVVNHGHIDKGVTPATTGLPRAGRCTGFEHQMGGLPWANGWQW